MKYEWEETRADGSVETWDIELREYKEPKFHLYDESCDDKHHPKMKCPVCEARLFDVETPEDKTILKSSIWIGIKAEIIFSGLRSNFVVPAALPYLDFKRITQAHCNCICRRSDCFWPNN